MNNEELRALRQELGLPVEWCAERGSTAIAAMQAGVQFIGVEMSERWFDVACERVEKYLRDSEKEGLTVPGSGNRIQSSDQFDPANAAGKCGSPRRHT